MNNRYIDKTYACIMFPLPYLGHTQPSTDARRAHFGWPVHDRAKQQTSRSQWHTLTAGFKRAQKKTKILPQLVELLQKSTTDSGKPVSVLGF